MIDFHTHIYPDKIAASTLDKLATNARIFPASDGTAAGLRASMERNSMESTSIEKSSVEEISVPESKIDLSVVLPVATNPLPEKVEHLNQFATKLDGSDGLLSIGGIHPDCPNWKEELKHIKDLGLKGIKIHPPYQRVALDDIRYLRIMEEAASLDLFVIAHMGYDVGLPGVKLCTPEMAANAIRQVGKFPFVLAHMGGWKDWDAVMEYLPGTGCYLDTAFSLGSLSINTETPIQELTPDFMRGESMELLSKEAFLRMVKTFGADHILFGSDSPWDDPMREVAWIQSVGLSQEEEKLIFEGNAKQLLKLY